MDQENNKELILTVGQFLDSVNFMLSSGRPNVVGEVSEFKISNRWVSFSLLDKEEKAILKCVMGIWDFKKIAVELEDGMEVKVSGTARITKSYGSFGLWVESIEPVGEGSLKKAYQLLLKRLEAEGLFARKRELKRFISNVGVITSRDGVVIQDFLQNLDQRDIKVNFINSRVEGKNAVAQVTSAIKWFNKNMPELDALVIIRGGGSLESMQAFNNELVCREVFASKIPVIAGVGHDVDVPITCLVADVSVSTPTATAHYINKSWDTLVYGLPQCQANIFRSFEFAVGRLEDKALSVVDKMVSHVREIFRNFEMLSQRIITDAVSAIGRTIESKRERLSKFEKVITLADPTRNLRLGYSLTVDSAGKVVRNILDIKEGSMIITRLAEGSIESKVQKVNK